MTACETTNGAERQAISVALLQFASSWPPRPLEDRFPGSREANRLVIDDPNAFLFMVLFNERVDASRAFNGPLRLRQRLGHLDPARIAAMEESDVVRILGEKPAIHVYCSKTAKRLKSACERLIQQYGGTALEIWRDVVGPEAIEHRFREFTGVGQKKASMAVNILVSHLGLRVDDRRRIDVSYDVQVRRVFVRTGLAAKDSRDAVLQAARDVNPSFPGALDVPAWVVGRDFCHPIRPVCASCPLDRGCARVGLIAAQ